MAVREPDVVREEAGWLSESLTLSLGRGWVAVREPHIVTRKRLGGCQRASHCH